MTYIDMQGATPIPLLGGVARSAGVVSRPQATPFPVIPASEPEFPPLFIPYCRHANAFKN